VLTTLLSKALEKRQILQENVQLKRQIEGARLGKMIGQSKPMQQLYDLLRRVAPTRTNVLIVGETGTGKELVARALHELSTRAKQAFVTVNCGAIPENLIESELFGHVKGSFTGAIRDKVGLFAAADGGTLFLDEIGELPLLTQVRLLRVLQERRLQPVGSTQELEVDVRVVAATNRDLVEEVRERRMREDLYYRLNVIQINMPPLRDRPEDIPLLTQHFVNKFAKEQNKEIEGLSPEAMQLLMGYRFPGNVRELENIVERAVTLSSSPKISTELLPSPMLQKEQLTRVSAELGLPEEGIDLEQMVEGLERSLLDKALARTKGNRTEAAKLLNISFRSLRYRLNKYGMGED
ncbi:MAG: sigma-54 dependent transcriptional regulator, partial [Myxococcota bacterium]|jgi:two-component system response regulator PilR (NtrC family)|nr:sigma-54 dependent transcriptional regulator [Myxococcota bacterium]